MPKPSEPSEVRLSRKQFLGDLKNIARIAKLPYLMSEFQKMYFNEGSKSSR